MSHELDDSYGISSDEIEYERGDDDEEKEFDFSAIDDDDSDEENSRFEASMQDDDDDDDNDDGGDGKGKKRRRARKVKKISNKKKRNEGLTLDDFCTRIQKEFSSLVTNNQRIQQPKCIINCAMKDYQIEGLNWLANLYDRDLSGILGDEMGLGKTLQSICMLAYLVETKQIPGPFLVITPLSTVDNWYNEFEKFCPSMKVVKYIGAKPQREAIKTSILDHIKSLPRAQRADPSLNFNVLLTTYDLLIQDADFLCRFQWRYFICDEAHRLKNPNSVLYSTLLSEFHLPKKLLLTGTPIQNNVTELWSILHFCNKDLFNDLGQWLEWFPQQKIQQEASSSLETEEAPEDATGSSSSGSNSMRSNLTNALHMILRPFLLRRRKKEVLRDLPSKREYVLYTCLSSMQQRYYRSILTKNTKDFKSIKGLSNIVMQLRKCCNHPYLFEGAEPEPFQLGEHLVNNSGKLILLDKLLKKFKNEGHKVLIFSQMTAMLDIIQDYLHFRDFTYERLDGSVRGEERFAAVNNFNSKDNETFVFLLSTRAGGLGLNLTSADTVIFFDSDWNPQVDMQAADRVYRIGQTRDVRIFRLITEHTVEEIMLMRAYAKLQMAYSVIEKIQVADKPAQLIDVIKYGLHKTLKHDGNNNNNNNAEGEGGQNDEQIPPEVILLSHDINDILGKAKCVSVTEITEKKAAADENNNNNNNNNNDVYTYEGKNYKNKKKTTAASTAADNNAGDDEKEEEEDADAKVLQGLMQSASSSSSSMPLGVVDTSNRTLNLRNNRKIVHDEEAKKQEEKEAKRRRKLKKWEKAGYISLAIAPDTDISLSSELEEDETSVPNGDEEEVGFALNNNNNDDDDDDEYNRGQKLHQTIGDVTKPHEGDPSKPKLIVNCVSDSGVWGNGGLFTAILKNLSDAPRRNYESAKENGDLHLGDAHLVPIAITDSDADAGDSGDGNNKSGTDGNNNASGKKQEKKQQQQQIYVVNVVVQKLDKHGSTSGILLPELEAALYRVAYAAKSLQASVHLPRIGAGHCSTNWYAIERILKKCLAQKGIHTYVYYFKKKAATTAGAGGSRRGPGGAGGAGSSSPARGYHGNSSSTSASSTPSKHQQQQQQQSPRHHHHHLSKGAVGGSRSTGAARSLFDQKPNHHHHHQQRLALPKLDHHDASSSPSTSANGNDKNNNNNNNNTSQQQHQQPLPAHPQSAAVDLFENMRICLYEVGDDAKALKRLIISNGGIVVNGLPDRDTDYVVTNRRVMNEEMLHFDRNVLLGTDNRYRRILHSDWVRECIRRNRIIRIDRDNNNKHKAGADVEKFVVPEHTATTASFGSIDPDDFY